MNRWMSGLRMMASGITFCLLTTALIALGCVPNEPIEQSEEIQLALAESLPVRPPPELSEPQEPPQPPQLPLTPEPRRAEEEGEPGEAGLQLPSPASEPVWAKEFEGQLIAGLDGELYEPYKPTAIEDVQRALMNRGLYPGPVHGVLDMPTMEAIYEFQKASYNLQLCGIPTPRTRTLLEQGSHTDPS